MPAATCPLSAREGAGMASTVVVANAAAAYSAESLRMIFPDLWQ